MKFDYDEISPITNNKCVLVDTSAGTSKMCMESGYNTGDAFRYDDDEEKMVKAEAAMPDIVVSTKTTDELGFTWYLSIVPTIAGTLIPMPYGTGHTWTIIPNKELFKELPAIHFPMGNFVDAMDELQRMQNGIGIKSEE